MTFDFNISEKALELCNQVEKTLVNRFADIDSIAEHNQYKVISAMQKNKLSSDTHFAHTTGYGYNDAGRDILEQIYADVFNTEAALVRPQLISGTHAISTALFANLKAGDELISATGKPYDTMQGIIGIRETKASLIDNGIIYKQADLLNDEKVDFEALRALITPKTKLIEIQRSKGYLWRHSFTVKEIAEIIEFIKAIRKDIIVMVDNCYGEFVATEEPSDFGADIVAGSLIKNPGGGLAPVGGYIVGKEEFIDNAAYRLTTPGAGREVGPSLTVTPSFLQGLFLAPTVVAASVKGAVLTAGIFEKLGYKVLPSSQEIRSDIVQAVCLNSANAVIEFCGAVQRAAPVDSFVKPEPWAMPGYGCDIIMAAGAFIQGSSIELSADAPICPPYNVFMQGGLTYPAAKLGSLFAADAIINLN